MGHLINVTLMLKEEINTLMNLRLIIWGTEDAVGKDLLSCHCAHSVALPRSHVLGLVFFRWFFHLTLKVLFTFYFSLFKRVVLIPVSVARTV